MDHQWPVEVIDDKGGTVASARVCMVEKIAAGTSRFPYNIVPATHTDQGGGKYEPSGTITPVEGEWLLIVSLSGKSPVVQRLTLKKKGTNEFITTAKGGQVATVSLSAAVRTVGGSKVRVTSFRVTLYPAAEIVAIAGMDYHAASVGGGTQFHFFAQNQAEAKRREKKIHAGTIVTIFSTSKIQRITRVMAAQGWVDVEVAQLGNAAARVAPPAHTLYQPKAGVDIHITDFYKYLSEVGTARPNSVIEVGIFSHSWPGGPIIYDTSEGAAFRGLPGRDPQDFDARAKDFNTTNMPGYPKLKDALAPGCRWVIWGCSATTLYKRRSLQARENRKAGHPADQFFVVSTDHSSGGNVSTTEERTSELRHRHEMDLQFRSLTYMAAVANAFDIETRGACPGVGSDFVNVDGLELMMVNLSTYAPVYAYFKEAFSPDFVPTNTKFDQGYVDYNQLRKRPVVPRPSFTSEYYYFSRTKNVDASGTVISESSTLTFWSGKGVVHSTVDAKLQSSVKVNLVTTGKTGHLYVLKDSNAALSQAVYAQEDGRIFKITKDGSGAWTVRGPEL